LKNSAQLRYVSIKETNKLELQNHSEQKLELLHQICFNCRNKQMLIFIKKSSDFLKHLWRLMDHFIQGTTSSSGAIEDHSSTSKTRSLQTNITESTSETRKHLNLLRTESKSK
jgi:hypothetical protein